MADHAQPNRRAVRSALLVFGALALLFVPATGQATCVGKQGTTTSCSSLDNCVGACCLDDGECPTSSCVTSFNKKDSSGDLCGKNNCQGGNNCVPLVATCDPDDKKKSCVGVVECTRADCGGRQAGHVCVYAGSSSNYKVCDECVRKADASNGASGVECPAATPLPIPTTYTHTSSPIAAGQTLPPTPFPTGLEGENADQNDESLAFDGTGLCYKIQYNLELPKELQNYYIVKPAIYMPESHLGVAAKICGVETLAGKRIPREYSCDGKKWNAGQLWYMYNTVNKASSAVGWEQMGVETQYFLADEDNRVYYAAVHGRKGMKTGGEVWAKIDAPGIFTYDDHPFDLRDDGKTPTMDKGADFCYDQADKVETIKTSDCYSWDSATGRGSITNRWAPCCNDGLVMGSVPATNFTFAIQYRKLVNVDFFRFGSFEGGEVRFAYVPRQAVENGVQISGMTCKQSCALRRSCGECASGDDCGWCDTTKKCMHKSEHALCPSNWVNAPPMCPACAKHVTCGGCTSTPGCGWCYGTGTCIGAASSNDLDNPPSCPFGTWQASKPEVPGGCGGGKSNECKGLCPGAKYKGKWANPAGGLVDTFCSGRGVCDPESGTCLCAKGYHGEGCQKVCPGGAAKPCKKRGTCDTVTGQCLCKNKYYGRQCQRKNIEMCHAPKEVDGIKICQVRRNNNSCKSCGRAMVQNAKKGDYLCTGAFDKNGNGECKCKDGWYGDLCQYQCPISGLARGLTGKEKEKELYHYETCGGSTSLGAGTCGADGTCICSGLYSLDPSSGICILGGAPGTCEAGGIPWVDLDTGDSKCCCKGAHEGADCSGCKCTNGGVCNSITGSCDCPEGFSGVLCEKDGRCTRDNNCNGNGDCVGESQCDCDPTWWGPDDIQCSLLLAEYGPADNQCSLQCLDDVTCSSRGTCMSDGSCQCYRGYTGANCDECAPAYDWDDSDECVLRDDECFTGDGSSYRGFIRTSTSGFECQAWATQSPNQHSYTGAGIIESANLTSNYCRNPDGADGPGGPWCFTVAGIDDALDTRGAPWELCTVPQCPPWHDAFEAALPVPRCEWQDKGSTDKGAPAMPFPTIQLRCGKVSNEDTRGPFVVYRVVPNETTWVLADTCGSQFDTRLAAFHMEYREYQESEDPTALALSASGAAVVTGAAFEGKRAVALTAADAYATWTVQAGRTATHELTIFFSTAGDAPAEVSVSVDGSPVSALERLKRPKESDVGFGAGIGSHSLVLSSLSEGEHTVTITALGTVSLSIDSIAIAPETDLDLSLIPIEERNGGPLEGRVSLGLVAGYHPYGGYEQLECNDDACEGQSRIDLEMLAGEAYYFVVTGYDQARGDYTFTLSKFQPYPVTVSITSSNTYLGSKWAGIGDEISITVVFSKPLAQRPNATIAGVPLVPAQITGAGKEYVFTRVIAEGDQEDGNVTFLITTGSGRTNEELGKPYNIDDISAPVGKDLKNVVFDGTRPAVRQVWMANADFAREGRVLREALPEGHACYDSWEREIHEAKHAAVGNTVVLGFSNETEPIIELAAKIAARDAAALSGADGFGAEYGTLGNMSAHFPELWPLAKRAYYRVIDEDDVDQGDVTFTLEFRDRVGNLNDAAALSLSSLAGSSADMAAWISAPVVLDTFPAELEDVEGSGSPSAPNDSRIAISIASTTRSARGGDTVTFKVTASHPVSVPPGGTIAGAPAEVAVDGPLEPAAALDCVESTAFDSTAGTTNTTFSLSGYSRSWSISRVVEICEFGVGVFAFAAHDDCHAQARAGGSLWTPLWNAWCWDGFGTISYTLDAPRDWAKNVGPEAEGPYEEDFNDEVYFESPVALAAKPRPASAAPSTPPVIVEAYLRSNNRGGMYPNLAKAGDTVTLSLYADQPIARPNVTIAGRPAASVEMASAPAYEVYEVTSAQCMDKRAASLGWAAKGASSPCAFGEQRCLELAAEECGRDGACVGFHAEVSLGSCASGGASRRRILQTCAQTVSLTYFASGSAGGGTGCAGSLYVRTAYAVDWRATQPLKENPDRNGEPPLLLPEQDDGEVSVSATFANAAGDEGALSGVTEDGCLSPAGVWLDTTPPVLGSISVVTNNSCGEVTPEVGKPVSLRVIYNEPLYGYAEGSVYIEARPSELAAGNHLGTQGKELGFTWVPQSEVNGQLVPGYEDPERTVDVVHTTVIQSSSAVLVRVGPVEDLAGNPGFGPWSAEEPHTEPVISGDLNDIISGDLGGDRPPPDWPFTNSIMTSDQPGETKNAVPGSKVTVAMETDAPVTIEWAWIGSASNQAATTVSGSGTTWSIEYTFTTGDLNGPIAFQVGFKEGACGVKKHRWLVVDEEPVIYDKFMPQVTELDISTNSPTSSLFLAPGNTITLDYVTNKLTWGAGGSGTNPVVEVWVCGVKVGEMTYTGPEGISTEHSGTFAATPELVGESSSVGPCSGDTVLFTIVCRDRAGNPCADAEGIQKERPSEPSDLARLYFDNTPPSVSDVSAGVAGLRCANHSFVGPACDTSGITDLYPGNYISVALTASEPVAAPTALLAGQEVPRGAILSGGCEDVWDGCGAFLANASSTSTVPTGDEGSTDTVDALRRRSLLQEVSSGGAGDATSSACAASFGAGGAFPHMCDRSCGLCSAAGAVGTKWDVYFAPVEGTPGAITYTLGLADAMGATGGSSGEVAGVTIAAAAPGSCAGKCGGAADDGSCSCAAKCRDEGTCCADAGLCCLDVLEETDRPGGCLVADTTPPEIAIVGAASSNAFWNNRVAIAGDTVELSLHTTEPTTRPRVRIGGTYLAAAAVVGTHDTTLSQEASERGVARKTFFESSALRDAGDEAGADAAYAAYEAGYLLSVATHGSLPAPDFPFPADDPPKYAMPYRDLSANYLWKATAALPSVPRQLATGPLPFYVHDYYESSPNELYSNKGNLGVPIMWNDTGVLESMVAPAAGVLFVNPPLVLSAVMSVEAVCCWGPDDCGECDSLMTAGYEDTVVVDWALSQGALRPTVVVANVKIPDADQVGATLAGSVPANAMEDLILLAMGLHPNATAVDDLAAIPGLFHGWTASKKIVRPDAQRYTSGPVAFTSSFQDECGNVVSSAKVSNGTQPATLDLEPPAVPSGYPVVDTIGGRFFTMSVQLSEPGYVEYFVSNCSTGEQVNATRYIRVAKGSTANEAHTYSAEVSGLLEEQTYCVAMRECDIHRNCKGGALEHRDEPVANLTVTTRDVTGPKFLAGSPWVELIRTTTTTLLLELNEPGTAYWVVGECAGLEGPFADMSTTQAVVDAVGSSASRPAWVVGFGTVAVPAEETEVFGNMTGLTQDTTYCVHVSAVDDQTPPNPMKDENLGRVLFHTADGIAPEITSAKMRSDNVVISGFKNATWGDTIRLSFTASEAVTTPLVELDLRAGVTMDDVLAGNTGCEDDPERECATVDIGADVADNATSFVAEFKGWQQYMESGLVGFRIYNFVDYAPFGAPRTAYPDAIYWTPNVGAERTGVSEGESPVWLDLDPPSITFVDPVTNNTRRGDKAGGIGDLVTVTLTADEPIVLPSVSVLNRTIEMDDIIGADGTRDPQTTWVVTCVMPAGPQEGEPLTLSAVPTDVMGNVGGPADETLAAVPVILDLRRPTLVRAALTSSNPHGDYLATVGDTLTLDMKFTEPVTTPTVTISGQAVTPTGDGDTWSAELVVAEGQQRDGLVAFEISAVEDTASGNLATQRKYVQQVPAARKAVLDTTPPAVHVQEISNNKNSDKVARPGNTVTLRIEFSEMVTRPDVTVANVAADTVAPMQPGYSHRGYDATVVSPADPTSDRVLSLVWVARRTIAAGDQPDGPVFFSVVGAEDAVGVPALEASEPTCGDFFPHCTLALNLMGLANVDAVPDLADDGRVAPLRTYAPAGVSPPTALTGWNYTMPSKSGLGTATTLGAQARDALALRADQISPVLAARYLAEFDVLAGLFFQRGGPCSFFAEASCKQACGACDTDWVILDSVPPELTDIKVESNNVLSQGALATAGDKISVTVSTATSETSTRPEIYVAGKRMHPDNIVPLGLFATEERVLVRPEMPDAPDCAAFAGGSGLGPVPGDGFCDLAINVFPCWDGGDCCAETCRGDDCGSGPDGYVCEDIKTDPIFGTESQGDWADYYDGVRRSTEYANLWHVVYTVEDDTDRVADELRGVLDRVEDLEAYLGDLEAAGEDAGAAVVKAWLVEARAEQQHAEAAVAAAGWPPEGNVTVEVSTYADFVILQGLPASAGLNASVAIDLTAPSVSNSTMYSRNANDNKWVANGGWVDLYFNTSEPVCTPKVVVNGLDADTITPLGSPARSTELSCPGYTSWHAERFMTPHDRDGDGDGAWNLATSDPVPFVIELVDLAGNEGATDRLTEFPDPAVVKWDEFVPVLVTLLIASDNDNDRFCRDGQNVTILMVADVPIKAPEMWVANEGKRVPLDNLVQLGPATWQAVTQLFSGDQDEGLVEFAVNITASERAGLRGCCEYTSTMQDLGDGATDVPPGVVLDTVPPATTWMSYVSNSAIDNKLADAGYVVTVTFEASEDLRPPPDFMSMRVGSTNLGTACAGVGCLIGGARAWRGNHTVVESEVGAGGDVVPVLVRFRDIAGNPGADLAAPTGGRDDVPVLWRDDTVLSVVRAVLWSDHTGNNALAVPGDTLFMALEFSMQTGAPTVRLGDLDIPAGQWAPVDPVSGFAFQWNLELTAPAAGIPEGVIAWTVNYADELGNAGPELADQVVSEDEIPPQVVFDRTAPVLIYAHMFSDSGVETAPYGDMATAGNVVTLQIDASEPIRKPQVFIGGREVPAGSVVGADAEWDATLTAAATDEVDAAGNLTMQVVFLDMSGTAGTTATAPIGAPPPVLLDVLPPAFTGGSPSATAVVHNRLDLRLELDEPGTVFVVALPRGAAAPTSANVFAFNGAGGSGALSEGSTYLPSGSAIRPPAAGQPASVDFPLTGLEPATPYDIYLVAHDRLGNTPLNAQAQPTLLQIWSAGVLVDPANVGVSEDGATASFTVRLTTPPAEAVQVTTSIPATAAGQVEFSVASGAFGASADLTFTAADWDTPVTVTVRAVDDAVVEGPHQVVVGFSAASGDATYDGVPVAAVTVAVEDNDGAAVMVTPFVRVLENETGVVEVWLETAPPGDDEVVVTLSEVDKALQSLTPKSPGESPPMVRFSAQNYNVRQRVVINPVADDVARDDRATEIQVTVQSSAALFNGVAVDNVDVLIVDVNVPAVWARVAGSPDINGWEPINDLSFNPPTIAVSFDQPGAFQVYLGSSPVAAVDVRFKVAKDDLGLYKYGQLVFTPEYVTFDFNNWDTPLDVQVEPVDDGVAFGDVEVNILFEATSKGTESDPKYDGIVPTPDLLATVLEGNAPGILLADDSGATLEELVVPEGECKVYNVFPATTPTAVITVTPAVPPKEAADDHDFTVSPASLTFGPTDAAPKPVTLCVVEDAVAQDPRETDITIQHGVAGSDEGYAALGDNAASLDATATDNDAGILLLRPDPVKVTEPKFYGVPGKTATVTASLTARPSHTVFVEYIPSEGFEGQLVFVSGKEMTFTPSNFAEPQEFTIYAVQDLVEEGSHNVTLCGKMSTQDLLYLEASEGEDQPCVNVVVEENAAIAAAQVCAPGGVEVVTDSGYGVNVPGGTDNWPDCLLVTAIEANDDDMEGAVLPPALAFATRSSFLNVSAVVQTTNEKILDFPAPMEVVFSQFIGGQYLNITDSNSTYCLFNPDPFDQNSLWVIYNRYVDPQQVRVPSDKTGYYILAEVLPVVDLATAALEVKTYIENTPAIALLPEVSVGGVQGLSGYDPVLLRASVQIDPNSILENDQLAEDGVTPDNQIKLSDCYASTGGCVVGDIRMIYYPVTGMLTLEPDPGRKRKRRRLQQVPESNQVGFQDQAINLSELPTLGDFQGAINTLAFINPSRNLTADTRRYALILEEPFSEKPVVLDFPIYVIPINDPPVVVCAPGHVSYAEHDPPRRIDAAVELSDIDNTHLTMAAVTLAPQFVPEDRLVFNMTVFRAALAAAGEPEPAGLDNITVAQGPAFGQRIEFRGTAPVLTYQALLRSVKFFNDGPKVEVLERVATFAAMDTDLWNVEPATRLIRVAPVNDPPQAMRQKILNLEENGVAIGQMVAVDPEEVSLEFTIVCSASKGQFEVLDPALGTYRYAANPGVNGLDKFVFLATDDGGLRSRMTEVEVRIGSLNDAPVAHNVTIEVWETLPQHGNFSATDADGDEDVSFFRVTGEPASPASLTLEAEVPSLFRSTSFTNFTYVALTDNPAVRATAARMEAQEPGTDWNSLAGTPRHPGYHADVIAYKAVDTFRVASEEAYVFVNIRLLRENNTAPRAEDMEITVDEGAEGVFRFHSFDRESPRFLTHTVLGQEADLGAPVARGLDFAYRPRSRYFGQDLFQYQAMDVQGELSNVANVTVHVQPVNDVPEPACGGQPGQDLSPDVTYALGERNTNKGVRARLQGGLEKLDALPARRFIVVDRFRDEVAALEEIAAGDGVFNISCGWPAAGVRRVEMGSTVAFALLAYDVDETAAGAQGRGANLTYHIVAPPERGSVYRAVATETGALARGPLLDPGHRGIPPPAVVFVDLDDEARGEFELSWAARDSDGGMMEPLKVMFSTQCAPGYFIDANSTDACVVCPPGTYNAPTETDQTECFACPPGSYAPVAGMTQCQLSPSNHYTPDSGMWDPIPCPLHAIVSRGASLLTQCRCSKGYFQVNDTYCGLCYPGRTVCDEVGQELPRPVDGFWVDRNDGFHVMECVPPSACVALPTVAAVKAEVCGPAEFEDGMVLAGSVQPYYGERCSKCSDGYYRSAGKCVSCDANAEVVFYICLIVPIIMFLAIIRLCQMGAGFGAVNVLMTWAQINASFRYLDAGWPERVLIWFRILSITNFNIELSQPECTVDGWNYITKLSVAHSVIVLWIVLACLYLLLSYLRIKWRNARRVASEGEGPDARKKREREEIMHIARVLVAAVLLSCSWGYAFFVEMTFEYFDCHEADGHQWLYSGPEWECNAVSDPNKLTYMMPLAVLGLLVYVVGLFVLVGSLLWRYRPTGPRPRIGALRRALARGAVNAEDMARDNHYRVMLGFLYKNYDMDCYYHEMVNFTKKGMIIITKVLMPNVLAQILVNMVCLFVTTLDVYVQQPYDSHMLDVMEMISSFSNLFVLFCGYLYYVDVWSDAQYDILTGFLTAFLMVSFILLLFICAIEMVPWCKRFVRAVARVAVIAVRDAMKAQEEEGSVKWMARSMFTFQWENGFRQKVYALVTHPRFDSTLMLLILVSSIASILGDQDVGQDVKDVCAILDTIFTVVFVCEALFKSIALGFVLHKGAYLRDGFNCLDFFIVCVACLSLLGSLGVSWVKNLRLLRYLRFLRLRYLRVLRLVLRVAREHGPAIMEECRTEEHPEVKRIMAKCSAMFTRDIMDEIRDYLRSKGPEGIERSGKIVQGAFTASGLVDGPARVPPMSEEWLSLVINEPEKMVAVYDWLAFMASPEEAAVFWEWIERIANETGLRCIPPKPWAKKQVWPEGRTGEPAFRFPSVGLPEFRGATDGGMRPASQGGTDGADPSGRFIDLGMVRTPNASPVNTPGGSVPANGGGGGDPSSQLRQYGDPSKAPLVQDGAGMSSGDSNGMSSGMSSDGFGGKKGVSGSRVHPSAASRPSEKRLPPTRKESFFMGFGPNEGEMDGVKENLKSGGLTLVEERGSDGTEHLVVVPQAPGAEHGSTPVLDNLARVERSSRHAITHANANTNTNTNTGSSPVPSGSGTSGSDRPSSFDRPEGQGLDGHVSPAVPVVERVDENGSAGFAGGGPVLEHASSVASSWAAPEDNGWMTPKASPAATPGFSAARRPAMARGVFVEYSSASAEAQAAARRAASSRGQVSASADFDSKVHPMPGIRFGAPQYRTLDVEDLSGGTGAVAASAASAAFFLEDEPSEEGDYGEQVSPEALPGGVMDSTAEGDRSNRHQSCLTPRPTPPSTEHLSSGPVFEGIELP